VAPKQSFVTPEGGIRTETREEFAKVIKDILPTNRRGEAGDGDCKLPVGGQELRGPRGWGSSWGGKTRRRGLEGGRGSAPEDSWSGRGGARDGRSERLGRDNRAKRGGPAFPVEIAPRVEDGAENAKHAFPSPLGRALGNQDSA